jgi:outer membrane protein OmpA-like peptidoglycan-associated protein
MISEPCKRRASILRAAASMVLAVTGFSAHGQTARDVAATGLTSSSTVAIGFTVGGGSTKVDMTGTELMSQANGEAKVQAKAKAGLTNIALTVNGMTPPSKLGAEYLTFVLWIVTPDGRTGNSGELLINKSGEGKLNATTPAQTFSLIITAEPYFAVRVPSEQVVLEMETRKNTKGKLFPASFQMMKRGQYEKLGNPLAMTPDLSRVPLEVYEARNAVDIARARGAAKYAPSIFPKAQASLEMAENALTRNADKKQIISTAKQAVQFAEDARALTAERQDQERVAADRLAAANQAKSEAEAKADAEAKRQAEAAAAEQARIKAEADADAQRQAEVTAAKEAQMKAEAETAALKAKMEADALRAKEDAARADAERARQAASDLRAQLLEQFNKVLPTTDTSRGLQVNMGDVLFDTGKYDLRIEAREGLAKLTGIVLSHPGLALAVEGYTDNVGTDSFNQALSQHRANAVRDYLVQQGLEPNSVSAAGFGPTSPVAGNDTPKGRQQNRRVEIIVSGEVIGTKIGAATSSL